MATDVVRYVNLGSSSGGDGTTNATTGANRAYASLTAAITAVGAAYPNFVTSDVRVIIECTGAALEAVSYTWPNMTMDATRYILIRVAAGSKHPGYYSSSKYGFSFNGVTGMTNVSEYSQWEDMQMVYNGSTNYRVALTIRGNAGTVRATRCVFHSTYNSTPIDTNQTPIQWVGALAKNLYLSNNVCTGAWSGILSMAYASGTVALIGNTVWGVEGGISLGNSNRFVIRGNSVTRRAGAAQPCYSSVGNTTVVTSLNVSDDSSGPQSLLRNLTPTFVDTSVFNVRPSTADTVLKGAGADWSADADLPVSVDISSSARTSPYSIGAWANAPGAGSFPFPFLNNLINQKVPDRDIRIGETTAARRRAPIHVHLLADGAPKTGLTAAKAKISWNGAAPVDTTNNFSYVSEEVYLLEFTQAEIDAQAVGDLGELFIPAGAGYQSLKTMIRVIQTGSYGNPLSSADIQAAAQAAITAEEPIATTGGVYNNINAPSLSDLGGTRTDR